ncbi:PREDICTED: probable helicase senataxin [Nanorana parkeri]|uniref:probable helicase senataxin n=1 Tax=Nanorana parkeri TaxID=125878 RepID=UPI0008540AB7|nr:PREDICTED: probable helicase senataxin [Nanorana parkeri]
MSTCRWCTPGGSVTAELLKSYAVKELPNEDCVGANDDLSYCMECVVEYHKARDEVPQLHKSLWPLETSRLIAQLENAMREEIEDDDELYLIEDDGEKQLFGYGGCSFESDVRVPLLEILKFPYLLLDKRISELSVEALCKMEQVNNTFQVYEKLPGVYLLLVHPNETIRHWAILTARAQGKVDRDDYYDLEEVFTCLFKVIELGLFENSDIYMYTEVEDGKLILLPSHLYDTSNYKNYWLGICMLLTVLEEQAMASLLLGPNKQNDFMQSILHVMEKQTEDESINPFWPALHCFMTILDRLGSKVWGQLIDPIQAFQTIIGSPSYNSEIEIIRKSCQRTTKCEPDLDDDDFVTCSQAVYSFNTEKVKKEAGWKSAICPDYCPNMYEDMQSLANILQSDIGQDMRVHNSTFLWFIPYVQSVMDLKDLGVAYIMEVIHHLSSEIKVVFTQGTNQCDKVTEFFVRVLVSVIELHRSKKCLHFLYISSHKWVDAIVKCALLPVKSPRITSTSALSSSPTSQTPSSVQFACMQLIRSLLREGYPLGQQAACKQYLDKFNLIIRGNVLRNLDLSKSEVQGLQTCLTQIIKNIKDKESSIPSSPADPNPASLAQAVPFIKTERIDDECCGANITSPYSSDVPVYPLERREVLKCQIKKEPPDERRTDVEYNSYLPSCSSRFKTQIKNEKLDDTSTLISAREEPKKLLTGWQSKLSEVMAKVPNLKPNATSVETESKISTIEGSTKPAQKPCYATIEEQTDLLLKVKSYGKESESGDLSDSDDNIPLTLFSKKHLDKKQSVTDNVPVSEQLQRLSLDNNPAGRPIKKEFQGVADISASSFLESNTDCIMDSETDDDDALPLCFVKEKLMKSSKKSALANTKMNRNSDHTEVVAQTKGSNFPDDSIRQACDVPDFCSIKRKVIGSSRALGDENVSCKTELSDIITISDDSDQEEEPFCKSVKIEKQDPGQDTKESPIQRTEQVEFEPVDPNFEEYGSQVFEFETQDDIYSAWSDSQLEEKKPNVQENLSSRPETSNIENFDQDNDLNKWGYDTDYVSDEIIEKAAEDAEQQFKALTSAANIKSGREHGGNKSPHEAVNSSVSFGKRSHEFVAAVDVKSKQTKLPKEPCSLNAKNGNTAAPATQKKALTAKTNKSKNSLKAQRPIQKYGSPGKASLAVVPPKKIHKCPEPTSTVEKLSLKKAPRKAFDLSQRSLDSLAELRNHGKSAGFMEAKKPKSKLISPQSILAQRNKKLLACQERQFYQQSRPKTSEKRKSSSSPKNSSKNAGMPTKQSGNSSGDRTSLSGQRIRAEKMKRPQKEPQGRGLVDVNKLYTSSSETRKDAESGGQPVVKLAPQSNSLGEDNAQSTMPVTAANTNDHKNDDDDDEEDDLFLTQTDPLDMDLCSQLEAEINVGTLQDLCTSGVVDHSPSVHQVTEGSKCSPEDCTEFVPVSSDNYPINAAPEKKDDHVFARPGLPLFLQKPLRPVTAKVYSAGTTSRTASLTKDLESLPKPLPNVKAKTQTSKPPVPRPTMQPPAQSKAPVSQTTSNVLKPLINQNNIPLQCTFNSVRGTGRNSLAAIRTPQRDQNWLVREVLHWSFEMFDNISQFGVSKKLCQLPLLKVRLEFSGYDEYFNTFCPLMLLNTFESLAQEWTVKQPALASHLCKLHLQNFCNESQMNRGEFQVWIRNVDLNMQRLPKEGDLVFLLVPEDTGSSPREESDLQGPPIYHTGHVSRFVRTQCTQAFEKEQYTLCELTIHTYGNLLPYRKQQVRCAVIGSLITTLRQFKALIQLQRNPLFKPIIHPTPAGCIQTALSGSIPAAVPISKEYNSDQRNAIEKANSMITQHPRLPRICMIHGPPGTGKSKTIVGLLYRILMENNVPDLSFGAKNKRNRVLVCAPSNAALDDLMKKIILEFKEKCRDKKNTLGNCGDINLVRLGAEKTISSDVVKFSLDCQVNYRIKRASQDPSVLRLKEALDRQLDELSRQRAMERCSKNTCEELDQRIARLTKERQCVANVLKEERRRPQEVKRNIILESHVICCTLSTSGGILLEAAFRQLGQEPFGCVIVDEAGQSCEVETLIPLLHRCCKLVLVGDPEQLPPTVISMKAEELGYGQSLMSRLCQILEASGSNTPVLQLTKQYRMHPDICLFPSKHFYNSVLRTDRDLSHAGKSDSVSPEVPPDLLLKCDFSRDRSFSNPLEIKMVVALIKLIKSKKKEFGFRNIGIITPYRAQKMKIINELKKTFGDNAMPGEVDTVDGFQGRQKDCIIVTCVRANSIQGCIGFLASRQRLNVTITRAKFSLFILGSLRTLIENKDWNQLIQDAQRRGALVKTKQEHYQRDVNRILKLNPVIQRTASYPPTKPVEVHKGGSPYTPPLEAPERGNNNPPVSGGPPHKRTIAHPAVDVGRHQVEICGIPDWHAGVKTQEVITQHHLVCNRVQIQTVPKATLISIFLHPQLQGSNDLHSLQADIHGQANHEMKA